MTRPFRCIAALAATMTTALLMANPAATAAPETVAFPDATGTVALHGYLWRPTGDGPFAAAVLMHGCGGALTSADEISRHYRQWADRLIEWGYVALLVDGFTPRGVREICNPGERPVSVIDDRPGDARGALRWLAARSFVDADRIALIGWSNGASATLIALAGKPPPGFRAAVAFYPGCQLGGRFPRTGWAPAVPTLILVGLADDWTPAAPCLDLAASAREHGAPVRIVAYDDAHHGFDRPGDRLHRRQLRNESSGKVQRTVTVGPNAAARDAAIRAVAEFLDRELGPQRR
jgi:dienelactone hydrolase